METNEKVLVCPAWPGRNPFIEVRKLTCADCRADVSIAVFNLPVVKDYAVRIICESCFEALKASGAPIDIKDEPIRSLRK